MVKLVDMCVMQLHTYFFCSKIEQTATIYSIGLCMSTISLCPIAHLYKRTKQKILKFFQQQYHPIFVNTKICIFCKLMIIYMKIR